MPGWLPEVIAFFNYVILTYVIVMQLQVMGIAYLSWRELEQHTFRAKHGRVHDLLTSDTTPPISIVIPAFNEAAGIAESVRSMTMLHYPKMEIIVVNDGSTDETLQRVIDAFDMAVIDFPFRPAIETQPIRRTYRSRMPLPVVLVDKANGGKSDAINAGFNVAQYPYVLVTDADMILEEDSLIRAARHFVDDREHTVAVGGNVRPLNGSRVRAGKVVEVRLPRKPIEMVQVVEYIRSFLAARPGWSRMGSLLIISGAFGIFRRSAVSAVGGFRNSHLGEDMEMTMRLHRHFLTRGDDYRIVYAPDAVAWTEVPTTWDVLRKQRIRWHRGLMQVIWQYRTMILNPRFGLLGMVAWPAFVAFEFVAPILEFIGWVVIPISALSGLLDPEVAIPLVAAAVILSAANSILSLYLDDRFGYYNEPEQTARMLGYSIGENLGLRQRSVWWRFRALVWNPRKVTWGEMRRRGVGNLASGQLPESS